MGGCPNEVVKPWALILTPQMLMSNFGSGMLHSPLKESGELASGGGLLLNDQRAPERYGNECAERFFVDFYAAVFLAT
jgi:hypothetical protein